MSYCRFSSDCHQSDVYVYADVNGGFTTHVAGRRRKPLKPVPEPPPDDDMFPLAYWDACTAWTQGQGNWEWQDITHEAAGQVFNDATEMECVDRLRALQAAGLNVPQYAIDRLLLDAEEGGESRG